MKRTRAAAAAIAVVGLLAGCSSGSSTEDANADYCAALNDLAEQLTALGQELTQDSTLDDLKAHGDDIQSAAQDVADAGRDVDDAVREEISQAQDDFEAAIAEIPGDATIGEARDAYQQASDDYLAAVGSAFDEVGCTDAGLATPNGS